MKSPILLLLLLTTDTVSGQWMKIYRAMAAREVALKARIDSLGPGHPALAAEYDSLGAACARISMQPEAMIHYGKALDIRLRSQGPDGPEVAPTYLTLARTGRYTVSLDSTLTFYEHALSAYRRLPGSGDSAVIAILPEYAHTLLKMERYQDAIGGYAEALTGLLLMCGPVHPTVAEAYYHLGKALMKSGDTDGAIVAWEQSLTFRQRTPTEALKETANLHTALGRAWKAKGRYVRALHCHERALALYCKAGGTDKYRVSEYYKDIRTVLKAQGRHRKADYYSDLSFATIMFSENNKQIGIMKWNHFMGSAFYSASDYDNAINHHRKALRCCIRALGRGDSLTHDSRRLLRLARHDKRHGIVQPPMPPVTVPHRQYR